MIRLNMRSFLFPLILLGIGTAIWQGTHFQPAQAEEGSEEGEGPTGVGPGKAITAASEKDGIRVSDPALKFLGIKARPLQVRGVHDLPSTAILYYQTETGVYRVRDGWFKLIEGKVLSKSSSGVAFEAEDLKPGDQVVTEGGPLLRLGELNIWDGGGDTE